MTNEEAIKTIKIAIAEAKFRGYPKAYSTAFKTAVEALEKQISKKPKVSFQSEFYWCPDCECAIKMRIEKKTKNISYCPFCGQALDWSERNGGEENG